MNKLETLYFPDTAIISDRQYPLFLFFSTIHLIRPVEADEDSEEKLQDTFMDPQFCQVHTPHPLGNDRDRFLYLINDIQNRKDDYAAQLSNITLASMSRPKTRGDGSKQEIISSLLQRDTGDDEDAAAKELEALWQARLILEIATILDRDVGEVAQSLVLLEESESDLFAKLKGNDEEEEENLYQDLVKIKSKLAAPRVESIHTRVRAWLRLINNTEIPQCPVWTTSRQEAADIFFENYEKKNNSPPSLIAELELPCRIGGNGQRAFVQLTTFRSEAEDQLQKIYQMVSTAKENLLDDPIFNELSSNWHQLVEHHYPAKEFGRGALRFYFFKNNLTDFSGNTADRTESGAAVLAIFES